ncbi:hypothetical protein HHI36_019091 [Cryptolaemus montrouzieri]|uniref:Uncharacterized protein n=1 Tax=Cryptolaemus montrouzieri TaxID=559131 RepID=A0ABD2P1Y9_9CUCU
MFFKRSDMERTLEEASDLPETNKIHHHRPHKTTKVRHKRERASEAMQVTSTALRVREPKKEKEYVTRVLGGTADETLLLSADVIYNLFSNLAEYAD